MMSSLGRLAALPDETRVYCGHEYTQKNLEFAVSLEPGNKAATKKLDDVRALRKAGKPTIPSTIAEEKATEPVPSHRQRRAGGDGPRQSPRHSGERSDRAFRGRSCVEGPLLRR
jgi:glyoxylase-like metal-dependent hydrolase (beta-lactamase superfamily II)